MKNIFILLLFSSHPVYSQFNQLKYGKHKPGFISVTRFDTSRPAVKEQFSKAKGRIIQINLWYPSSTANSKVTSFQDYVGLIGKELNNTSSKNWKQAGIDRYFEWPALAGADKNKFISFLNDKQKMMASLNAKWTGTKYPLIMLVHGFAADYAYLGEYLASYGYIVMHVPVKGTTQYELDYEGLGLQSQVKDYEFALDILNREFPWFTAKTAVVGFSFGGQSAVALAIRNNANAVISFDGGIGSAFGASLLSRQPYYNDSLVTMPLLHLYNPADTYTDLSWFNTVTRTTRLLAPVKNMQHGFFTSFGLLNKVVPGIMGKDVADPGNNYEAVMLLTKEFLNATVKNNETPALISFFSKQRKAAPWIDNCIGATMLLTEGS